MITNAQRSAAKAAGMAYLVTFIVVVTANFGIHERLNVPGDALATARNILAHQQLFRVGIGMDLIYSIGLVALLTALYVILEPVSRGLALLATLWKLVYAFAWTLTTMSFYEVLRLETGADYLHAFEPSRLQALAKLYLAAGFDRYYGGLLFWTLGGTVASYLWMKSRYIPRVLAIGGLVSYAWCALCTAIFLIVPDFSNVVNLWWFDTPMALFELATSFWLLFKGLSGPGELHAAN